MAIKSVYPECYYGYGTLDMSEGDWALWDMMAQCNMELEHLFMTDRCFNNNEDAWRYGYDGDPYRCIDLNVNQEVNCAAGLTPCIQTCWLNDLYKDPPSCCGFAVYSGTCATCEGTPYDPTSDSCCYVG